MNCVADGKFFTPKFKGNTRTKKFGKIPPVKFGRSWKSLPLRASIHREAGTMEKRTPVCFFGAAEGVFKMWPHRFGLLISKIPRR
jgi:hypothetical protein